MYKFRDVNGKALGTQHWEVDSDKYNCMTYTGLWKDKKVVALLVAQGDYDTIKDELEQNGNFIVKACNVHKSLVDALDAIASMDGEAARIASLALITNNIL